MGIGAWEQEQPEVLICILTRELVSTRWALSLREMEIPNNSCIRLFSGMPFDHARNSGCQAAMNENFKWLFFLDDDVIVPPFALRKLLSNNLPIVSGLYYRRALPIQPVALFEDPNGGQPRFASELQAPNIHEVDLVGAGCLLINSEVFRKVPSPWFDWLLDHDELPPNQRCSEDFAFCRKAKKFGYKIHLDTGVQCKHVGMASSCFGGNYVPLQ